MDFRNPFAHPRALFVVVHVRDWEQAIRNVVIAFHNGADGVFLISHGHLNHTALSELVRDIKEWYPERWIGVNYLDLAPANISFDEALNCGADGVWVDNPYNYPKRGSFATPPLDWLDASYPVRPVYFGGVAFKYQPGYLEPGWAAKHSSSHLDVVTTSGSATGSPPDVTKIASMREAMGIMRPLALASGVAVDNVELFLPYVNYFLVASSLEEADELIPDRVKQLADLIHNYLP